SLAPCSYYGGGHTDDADGAGAGRGRGAVHERSTMLVPRALCDPPATRPDRCCASVPTDPSGLRTEAGGLMTAPTRRAALVGLIATSLSALTGCWQRTVVVGRDASSRGKRNLKEREETKTNGRRGRSKSGR